MFGRKKAAAAKEQAEATDETGATEAEVDESAEEEQEAFVFDRANGPFDSSEVDPDPEEFLDLGALGIPLVDGLEVRVEVDENTKQPAAVTLVQEDGAVQVRAFAGPKSGGLWEQARGDISRQITGEGGTLSEVMGPFGPEILAQVNVRSPDGSPVRQEVRFVGVDGPKWMLQGVFFGAGANPDAFDNHNEVFQAVVVDRGEGAMPRGAPLTIVLPEGAQEQANAAAEAANEE